MKSSHLLLQFVIAAIITQKSFTVFFLDCITVSPKGISVVPLTSPYVLGCTLDTASPGMVIVSSGLDTVSPGLDTVSPGLDIVSPGLDTVSPGLVTVSPGLDTASPGLPEVSTDINSLVKANKYEICS